MPYGFSSSYYEPPMRNAEVYFTRVGIEKVYDFSYEWNDETGSFAEIDPYKSADMKYFTCFLVKHVSLFFAVEVGLYNDFCER